MNNFIPSKGLFDNDEVTEEFCLKVFQRTLRELKKWSDENPTTTIFDSFKRLWERAPSDLRKWYGSGNKPAYAGTQVEDDDGPNRDEVVAVRPKKSHTERPLIDIIVFRFPDEQQPQFVVYRLKLSSWTSIIEANYVTQRSHKVNVGTRGEYHTRRFKVREEFVKELRKETREKSLQEATNFLSKCKL